ncbi:MAG: 50S ribosomal protein L6 [Patescibacteria group bacterium]|jgi:large subunit ribosomal protein L6|nr:50S ribosomal protein L6 [Patescibacteria group bacterium]
MSRIGKQIINLPEKIELIMDDSIIKVKGPKGELSLNLPKTIKVKKDNQTIIVNVENEDIKEQRSLWGTYNRLINNMVIGVSQGFEKKLEINGVGYRAEVKGKILVLNVGYSHPFEFEIPEGIEIKVEKNVISVAGIDKQLIGETAARIRKIRKPEPYKGKGIKYADEIIRRKVGKRAAGSSS